jgi:hypothetical protein
MRGRTIMTGAGALKLVPVTPDQLWRVARYWPMGPVLRHSDYYEPFGLPFQIGESEVWGVAMQPRDWDEATAVMVHHLNRMVIACALPHYLEKGHRGVMVPCAYLRTKGALRFESGLAFFVGPDEESASRHRGDGDCEYDSKLGAGATRMIRDMMAATCETRSNLEALLLLLDDASPDDLVTRAEALRELGERDTALATLDRVRSRRYQPAVRRLRALAESGDRCVELLFPPWQ